MGSLSSLYGSLPPWAQHLAVSTYGTWWRHVRLGGTYQEHVARFRERETWSTSDWETWTRDTLRRGLAAAARDVPYYAHSWSAGQRASAADGDLAALPLLGKEAVRRAPERFVSQASRGHKTHTFLTSGTSGTPLRIEYTRDELQASMAVREVRSAGWAGVSFEDPRATFSGRIVVPADQRRGPFHRYNRAERQVYFSAFHVSPRNAPDYVRALRTHRTEWLTGYAVSTSLLARAILERGLDAPRLRAIVTTSEKLDAAMREVIEAAFRCPVFEEYGTVENASFASACEHQRLHVSPDVGVVEILDEKGVPCPPGTVGEVVVTSLMRRHQPLVRFRLGDLAAWSPTPCPCGRPLPALQEVLGRLEDVVRTPDGRETVRFHGLFVGLDDVVEAQVVQHALARLEVRVHHAAPSRASWNATRSAIGARVHERLGADVAVDVVEVDRIERDASGKFRAVVSRLEGTDPSAGAAEAPAAARGGAT